MREMRKITGKEEEKNLIKEEHLRTEETANNGFKE